MGLYRGYIGFEGLGIRVSQKQGNLSGVPITRMIVCWDVYWPLRVAFGFLCSLPEALVCFSQIFRAMGVPGRFKSIWHARHPPPKEDCATTIFLKSGSIVPLT